MPDSTIGLHHSARLTYRAVEPDEDEAFFLTIDQDSVAFHNSSGSLPVPPGKRSTKEGIKWITEEPLVSAVICLPATEATGKPIPIGYIHVGDKNPADRRHHRRGDIGLGLAKEYRGQGYGSEAIRWILHFAFLYAGFHRVGIGAFEYNEGAVRLYEKLGFKREGVEREAIFSNGKFWDIIELGMLEREWRELQEKK